MRFDVPLSIADDDSVPPAEENQVEDETEADTLDDLDDASEGDFEDQLDEADDEDGEPV